MENGERGAEAMQMDPLGMASVAVEDLYQTRDTYFPRDPLLKTSSIHTLSSQALAALDAIPPEKRKQSSRRAIYEYLRGKVLDVSPDYYKEAEDHLSKAVKLDPTLADAWLCLGNCLWKKGDLAGAKNCFSLALKKGPNKKLLRQLSMLERRLAHGTSDEVDVVEESIQHAKKAVMLDVKDGQSWYALGNAYLSSFFITGAWDQNKLYQCLKAYQNAEKDELANNNPDLYFNSAMANRYLENYERALSGFETASLKDPGLNADQEVEKLVRLLTKLEESSINKGQMKSKRHASLVSSLGNENSIAPPLRLSSLWLRLSSLWLLEILAFYIEMPHAFLTFDAVKLTLKPVTMQFLHEGFNRDVVVIGKVLLFIPHENGMPLYYVVSDAEGRCFILSIYGLRNGVIKESDTVTLLEPSYRNVCVSWKNKTYHFKAIRVDFLQQILLNGHIPSVHDAVRSTFHAQHILP